MKYPRFVQALEALAPTIAERARLLGINRNTEIAYRLGRRAPKMERVRHIPSLARALAEDLAAEQFDDEPAALAA